MVDGKPTVSQIAEASVSGQVKYDVVQYHGVDILILKSQLRHAIEITAEFTHNPFVEKLAEQQGIKLRRFR